MLAVWPALKTVAFRVAQYKCITRGIPRGLITPRAAARVAEVELVLEIPEEELERLEWACKARGFHSIDACVREAIRLLLARYKYGVAQNRP
jgi:hypothetical protein